MNRSREVQPSRRQTPPLIELSLTKEMEIVPLLYSAVTRVSGMCKVQGNDRKYSHILGHCNCSGITVKSKSDTN